MHWVCTHHIFAHSRRACAQHGPTSTHCHTGVWTQPEHRAISAQIMVLMNMALRPGNSAPSFGTRAQQPHKTRRLIRLLPPNPRRAASHTPPPPSTWKASRAQRPHTTHRLISPPLWDPPPRGRMAGWGASPWRPVHLYGLWLASPHSLLCMWYSLP